MLPFFVGSRYVPRSAVTPTPITPIEISLLRRLIGPLALIVLTPPLTLALWLIVVRYDGSIVAFTHGLALARFAAEAPRPSWWAAGIIVAWAALQWLLLRLLPGAKHLGPITASGARPEYKRNGVAAWAVTHALLVAGFATGVLSGAAFFARYGEILATLTLSALVICVALYLKAIYAPTSPDRVRTGYLLFDFFQGIELHPRAFGVSLKQLVNCRISMMGWSAIVVAFSAHQLESLGRLTPAMCASALLLLVYLFKFFWWETGYFASLDIMHDRFGYYICWGVLAWVPALYPIAQLYIAAHPPTLGWSLAAAIVAFGLASIWVNYAADAQRQRTRETSGAARVWGRPAGVIVAKYRTQDGVEHENLLLVSGYWGLARHFHYVPEIGLALAWSLPAGFSHLAPYLYVIFLSILLFDRATRDDERCAVKYGAAWAAYRKRVRYKIIPGVY